MDNSSLSFLAPINIFIKLIWCLELLTNVFEFYFYHKKGYCYRKCWFFKEDVPVDLLIFDC